jgi:hypothetical protein
MARISGGTLFTPISLDGYVKLHMKGNPGTNETELRRALQAALDNYKKGIRCRCGEPIWVLGASQVGNMCFTCITLEAMPDSDYELEGACDKIHAPRQRRRKSAGDFARGTEDDVPF